MSPELSRGSTQLVFQYGSNMDRARLNSSDRLDGAAELRGLAETIDGYDLVFNVWSSGQQCAVANLVKGPHTIYGVLYEIPDFRVLRTLKQGQRRSMKSRARVKRTNEPPLASNSGGSGRKR
jgi:hypothetical protein